MTKEIRALLDAKARACQRCGKRPRVEGEELCALCGRIRPYEPPRDRPTSWGCRRAIFDPGMTERNAAIEARTFLRSLAVDPEIEATGRAVLMNAETYLADRGAYENWFLPRR